MVEEDQNTYDILSIDRNINKRGYSMVTIQLYLHKTNFTHVQGQHNDWLSFDMN